MNILSKLSLCLCMVMLVSACATPASPPTATPTATVDAAATTAAENNRVATAVAATLTAQPTATQPSPTPTATETLVPTATEPPPTATTAPTATPAPTRVPPTRAVVATQIPPTQAPASDSVYSWTGGGPGGYTSFLYCTQVGGAPCLTTMAPGDVSFAILLQSTVDALEVIFYPFGLSVERDGANVADMYMTADAGWLPPGSQASFGTSRTFSVPGRYVVRTNGCLFTQANWASGLCNWWTLNGTVVTFDIR